MLRQGSRVAGQLQDARRVRIRLGLWVRNRTNVLILGFKLASGLGLHLERCRPTCGGCPRHSAPGPGDCAPETPAPLQPAMATASLRAELNNPALTLRL